MWCIYLKEDDRWPNDEARSVTLITVREGTKIRVYDSPDPDQSQRMQEDDWAEITVTKSSETAMIPTFESTYSDTCVDVVYNQKNGLDGKVSTIEIIPPD